MGVFELQVFFFLLQIMSGSLHSYTTFILLYLCVHTTEKKYLKSLKIKTSNFFKGDYFDLRSANDSKHSPPPL